VALPGDDVAIAGVDARSWNVAATTLGPTNSASDPGEVVVEQDDVRARLLVAIEDALKLGSGASREVMELARAFDALSQSSPPRPNEP